MSVDNGREDKNPWEKWFWSDWLSDSGVRACSVAARGLWIDLLAVMSRSKRKGYLLIGDNRPDNKTISKLIGEPEALVEVLMKELQDNNVYSVDPNGLIYNRRMQRETAIREARAEAGKKGMRRRWGNNKAVTRCHNKPITDSASSSLSSLSSIEEPEKSEEPPDPQDIQLTQLLLDLIIQNDPKSRACRISKSAQAQWIRQCRLLRTMDGRTRDEIEAVVRFSQSDPFWSKNVLSMPTLRKQFDRLWLKSKSTGGQAKLSGIGEWLKEQEHD